MHENLIKLLSEALKFYAEDANYVNGQIEKDKGHQAKFILNLVKQNEDQMNKIEKEYEDIQSKIDPTDEIKEMINLITNTKQ